MTRTVYEIVESIVADKDDSFFDAIDELRFAEIKTNDERAGVIILAARFANGIEAHVDPAFKFLRLELEDVTARINDDVFDLVAQEALIDVAVTARCYKSDVIEYLVCLVLGSYDPRLKKLGPSIAWEESTAALSENATLGVRRPA